MAKIYNIFISHSWTHNDDLVGLKDLLESRGYFKVEFWESTRDSPINSSNTSYVKMKLKERILSADIVLGIAGIYATNSDWIAWELETAYNNAIPIIGVIPRGQERISSVVNEYSIDNVRWNTESIVAAIRVHSK
ncbi:TIR domain-containing protein [Sphingobacterium siyangense]|uniref:TIR domain-containing protein n=1 Tax=Sphingobacterium siyangense TaxID=459529 RepID=UPI001AE5708A